MALALNNLKRVDMPLNKETKKPYLINLSAKHGGLKYHFLSLWHDLTKDWTLVFRTTGEHTKRYAKKTR